MAIYKRREFKVGDLVILNQTKLQDIPASLVCLALSTINKIIPRFRVVEISDNMARIKHVKSSEEFNVSVKILVAAFNNVRSNRAKKIVVVNVNGIEIFGKLIKYIYKIRGKIQKEDGEIVVFNSSKNNLGFVEEI